MFQQSVKKEMSQSHLQYIHSYPKEWRADATIFNLVRGFFKTAFILFIFFAQQDDLYVHFWRVRRGAFLTFHY